jgi:hypothetical protein
MRIVVELEKWVSSIILFNFNSMLYLAVSDDHQLVSTLSLKEMVINYMNACTK